jgi:hypothetical protein
MKIRNLLAAAALCLAGQSAPGPLFADGGEEILVAHPMPLYPGSVEAGGAAKQVRLSKDGLAAAQKFFEMRLKPGDKVKPFSGDGEAGFDVTYTKKVGSRELTVMEVRVTARTEKRPPHQAFGELGAQVSAGRHEEAELKAIEKEYGEIDSAYFRRAAGQNGDEAAALLARAHKQAHPDEDKLKAAGRKSKVSDEDKAEAKELKKKMKELKAQGDFAGMMALAQSSKKFQAPPAGQAEAAKLAAQDRNRDTWDLWLNCLKETKAAAYRTRLEYSSDALKD